MGITTLFVTHDQEECFSISDKVAVMNRGVIEQYDTCLLYTSIPGVLKELDRQSVEYACVEQDIMRNLNPREALTMSYLAMKESGYVW